MSGASPRILVQAPTAPPAQVERVDTQGSDARTVPRDSRPSRAAASSGGVWHRLTQMNCDARPAVATSRVLEMAGPDDPAEVHAERTVAGALGGSDSDRGSTAPATVRTEGRSPRAGPPQRGPLGPALAVEMETRLLAASGEARPLAPRIRREQEALLGHDFSRVRVHQGRESAAAARRLGARAFTLGHDVYFGDGAYAPGTPEGQRLLAHELVHVMQDRPNRIARRALPNADTQGAPWEFDAAANGTPDAVASDAVDDIASGNAEASAPMLDRLAELPPDMRLRVLARLRAQAVPERRGASNALTEAAVNVRERPTGPAPRLDNSPRDADSDRDASVTAAAAAPAEPGIDAGLTSDMRAEAVRGSSPENGGERWPAATSEGERRRGVVLRTAESHGALRHEGVAAAPAVAPHPSTPAVSTAAARLRDATRVVAGPGEAAPQAVSPDASSGGSAPASRESADSGPGSRATAAAAQVQALISAQAAQLSAVASRPVHFLPRSDRLAGRSGPTPGDLAAERSAAEFVAQVASSAHAVLDGASDIPAQVLTALLTADGSIREATASRSAELLAGKQQAHARIHGHAAQASAAIASGQRQNEKEARDSAEMAAVRGHMAYDRARRGILEGADEQNRTIDRTFADAEAPMKQVGWNASHEAWLKAHDRKIGYVRQKNGESSILDGPYHDDQCDARAEAAEKVGEEYGKSFRESAVDQAAKLADGKPAVADSIAQVVKQLTDGLQAQQRQVNDGVDAFASGAAAQSRRTAAGIGRHVTAGAAAADAAVETSAAEALTAIEGRSAAECRSLDEMAAAALIALGAGVARAAGEITSSVGTFAATAAGTAAPPEAALADSLDEAGRQVQDDTAVMSAQLGNVAPHASAMLAQAAGASAGALEVAAGSARDALSESAAGYGASSAALRRNAAAGFRALSKGNDRTANDIAGSIEDGFEAAQSSAAESFGLFGQKVNETLADGRTQMFGALWSDKNRGDLDRDIGKYADEAAAQVKPRWKRVLKWVITIVVMIAVVAITIVSAGALGPVGVILLGAALGAAAGAVTTIADNLLDGRHWSDGVAKAMIAGAIGGAVGGAAGLAVKGVGSVAVKFALEQGINIAGGVAGEAIGSVAVGESVDWHGALMGALTGAAIGAGLHIAGAMKGRVRFGGVGEPPMVKPAPPTLEPAPPAGRIRGMLEKGRILAPRAAAPAPSMEGGVAMRETPANVGGSGSADSAKIPAPKRTGAAPSSGLESSPPVRETSGSGSPRPSETTTRVDATPAPSHVDTAPSSGSTRPAEPQARSPESDRFTMSGSKPEPLGATEPRTAADLPAAHASPAAPEAAAGKPLAERTAPKAAGAATDSVAKSTAPDPASAPSATEPPPKSGPLIVDLQSGPMTGPGGERSFLRQRVSELQDARGVAIEPGDYRLGYERIQPTGPRDLRFARMLMHNLPEFPGPRDIAEAAAAGRPGDWPAHRFDPAARFPQTGDVRMLGRPATPGTTPTPAEFFPPVSRSGRVVPTDLRDVLRLRPTTNPELHGQVSEAYWRRPFGLGTADAPTVEALGRELDAMVKPGGFVEFRVLPSSDARIARQVQQHMPGSRLVEVPQRAIRQYADGGFAQRPAGLSDEQWAILRAAESDIRGSHNPLGAGEFNRILRIYKGTGAAAPPPPASSMP